MTRSRRISSLAIAMMASSVALSALWADAPATAPSSAVSADSANRTVNARRALFENVKQLSVDNVALSRVIEFLRDTSGANIVVNWRVLEGAGVARETPVSIQVRELTLRKMLRLVLDQASPNTFLVYNVDANVIEITSQEEADKQLVTKVYVVDDLVMPDMKQVTPPQMDLSTVTKNGTTSGGSGAGNSSGSIFTTDAASNVPEDTTEKRGEDLAKMVREVVRPAIWRENGGPASIRYFTGKLIVTAPISIHEAIGGPVAPEGGQRLGM